VPGAAAADDLTVESLPAVTDRQLAATVSDLVLRVQDIRLPKTSDVVRTRSDQGSRVIDLDTDLLFGFDPASLAKAGVDRIRAPAARTTRRALARPPGGAAGQG